MAWGRRLWARVNSSYTSCARLHSHARVCEIALHMSRHRMRASVYALCRSNCALHNFHAPATPSRKRGLPPWSRSPTGCSRRGSRRSLSNPYIIGRPSTLGWRCPRSATTRTEKRRRARPRAGCRPTIPRRDRPSRAPRAACLHLLRVSVRRRRRPRGTRRCALKLVAPHVQDELPPR